MRDTFLSFSPPSIGPEEIEEVVATLKTDWITTGPKARRFEEALAAFVGAPGALAVSSATDALQVGLAALGIAEGDEVITTPMTFCSTVHVIEHMRARPVLVDVEPDTLCIDPELVARAVECSGSGQAGEGSRQRAVGSRQKAVSSRQGAEGSGRGGRGRVRGILPVHLYGHPCEMDALLKIAESHGLFVLEDAAHSLPAKYKSRLIGAPVMRNAEWGMGNGGSARANAECGIGNDGRTEASGEWRVTNDGADATGAPHSALPTSHSTFDIPHSAFRNLVAFSFYATKNMTTAEGGMLVGEPELIEAARLWSLHGMSRDAYKRYSSEGSWFYEVVVPGFKCNMTDIQASLGLQQLKKLPTFQARRREIVRRYTEAFSQIPELQLPIERPEVESAWHIYAIRLHLDRLRINRSQFIEEMKARNIGTSVHFIPVHLHPYYRDKYGFTPEDFPVAYREYQRLVSLPLYPRMTDRDVEDVIEAVGAVVKTNKR